MSGVSKQKEFTGKHMLAIVVTFFGIIIVVNITMATMATRTWTGLIAKNTHTASQQFNTRSAQGREQLKLGWSSDLTLNEGRIIYHLKDKDGEMVRPVAAKLTLHRPTTASQDQELQMSAESDGSFSADVTLADGQWILQIQAEIPNAPAYNDTRRITVLNGELK